MTPTRGPYGRHGLRVRIGYVLVALLTWPLVRLFRRRRHAVVLCYHGIKPNQAGRFAWQVSRVAGRAVNVSELTASRPPARSKAAVCFTFDDAFANVLENAVPVLRQYGVPGSIFAVSENLGSRPQWRMEPTHSDAGEPIMTAAQLREIVADGVCTLGSHTCTHPILADLPPAALSRELRESRERLSELAGRPVADLALPHGSFTGPVIEAALAAGYERVYTLEPKAHDAHSDERIIGRFLMSPDAWKIEFVLTCEGAYAWLQPWRRFVRRVRRGLKRPAATPEPASA